MTQFCIDCLHWCRANEKTKQKKCINFQTNSLTTTNWHLTNQKKKKLPTCTQAVIKCSILHEKHLHKQNRTEKALCCFNNSWYLTTWNMAKWKYDHWNVKHLCCTDKHNICVVFILYWEQFDIKNNMTSCMEWLHRVGIVVVFFSWPQHSS